MKLMPALLPTGLVAWGLLLARAVAGRQWGSVASRCHADRPGPRIDGGGHAAGAPASTCHTGCRPGYIAPRASWFPSALVRRERGIWP